MHARLRLVVVLVAVAGGLGLTVVPAQAKDGACPAPGLTWTDALRPEATTVIQGSHFWASCNANNAAVLSGCGAASWAGNGPGQSLKDIRVTLTQDGRTHLLGVVDANQSYEFRLEAQLPAKLRPGPATLRAEGDEGGKFKQKVEIHQKVSHRMKPSR